mgnify:CR=1 FL=1
MLSYIPLLLLMLAVVMVLVYIYYIGDKNYHPLVVVSYIFSCILLLLALNSFSVKVPKTSLEVLPYVEIDEEEKLKKPIDNLAPKTDNPSEALQKLKQQPLFKN